MRAQAAVTTTHALTWPRHPPARRRGRLGELRKTGDPIEFRRSEVPRRAALEGKAARFGDLARGAVAAWPRDRPWLNETHTTAFAKQAGPVRCPRVV